MKEQLVIGTRGSKLALWQAEWVCAELAVCAPWLDVRVEVIKTSGDIMKDAPLSVIGGQGAFTKELEHALLDRRIDLAVHSLKDLPTLIPAELTLAAVTEREDPREALVLPAGAAQREAVSVWNLPIGARVGTSSPRRRAQLRYLRSDLVLKELRGNVDTRLRKLDAGQFDAIVLAAAGLRRLGLAERISAYIPIGELLPAVGQGALGLEARVDDPETLRVAAQLDHAPTRAACTSERALLRQFGAVARRPSRRTPWRRRPARSGWKLSSPRRLARERCVGGLMAARMTPSVWARSWRSRYRRAAPVVCCRARTRWLLKVESKRERILANIQCVGAGHWRRRSKR